MSHFEDTFDDGKLARAHELAEFCKTRIGRNAAAAFVEVQQWAAEKCGGEEYVRPGFDTPPGEGDYKPGDEIPHGPAAPTAAPSGLVSSEGGVPDPNAPPAPGTTSGTAPPAPGATSGTGALDDIPG